MKFRPILFSTPMVQAIMGGNKTQTRRIMGDGTSFGYRPKGWSNGGVRIMELSKAPKNQLQELIDYCKYGQIGDVLWVKETFLIDMAGYSYKANRTDELARYFKWKPSIFMPKAAARIFLRITDIRVERLQDISEDDAIAEGIEEIHPAPFVIRYECYQCDAGGHKGAEGLCDDGLYREPIDSFRSLWQSINGNESWNLNPWVWVIEFERIEKPQNWPA
jgi:hypothetical protein